MLNESEKYYVRQYERAYTNNKRNQVVREARAQLIKLFIKTLKSGTTKFKLGGLECGIMGKDFKEIKGWIDQEKMIKDLEKELRQNETTTWDHSNKEARAWIQNSLVMGSAVYDEYGVL